MQEVSEKYNNDSYRERHALSVERLRALHRFFMRGFRNINRLTGARIDSRIIHAS